MLSMPWFLLVPIAKACPTRKRYAGSTRPVALSLTLWLSSPSSPSRNQKCHQSSPPPARRFPPPCKHTSLAPVKNLCYEVAVNIITNLYIVVVYRGRHLSCPNASKHRVNDMHSCASLRGRSQGFNNHFGDVRGGRPGRAGQIRLAGRAIRKPVKRYIELGCA